MEDAEQMNEIVKAYAKEKNITLEEAMVVFKKSWAPKTSVGSMVASPTQRPQLTGPAEPGEQAAMFSDQTRLEMRKIELQEKQLALETKKAEAEDRKQATLDKKLDQEMEFKKLELKQEKEYKEAANAVERERAATERMILLANIGGKKPDELIELIKSQNEKDKAAIQAGAEQTKEFYKNLIESKDSAADRDMKWKTSVAQIEADKEIEIAKLRQQMDAETASTTDAILNKMDERFGAKADATSKSAGSSQSFIEQMKEYKKMQDEFLGMTFDTLEARGFDKDQLTLMKKAANIEEKKQGTVLEKIGNYAWEKLIAPQIEKTTKEAEIAKNVSSGLEATDTQNNREEIRRQEEELLKREEALNLKAQKQQYEVALTENAALRQQKQILEANAAQHQALIGQAAELGIPTTPEMPDQQIADLIWQAIQQRETLVLKAKELGIPIEPLMTDAQIFDLIEHKEAAVEQERKDPEEKADLGSGKATDAVPEESEPERSNTFIDRRKIAEKGPVLSSTPLATEGKPKEKTSHKAKPKEKKETQKYTVSHADGTLIGTDIEAVGAKGAALKCAMNLNGSRDVPVRVKVTDQAGKEILYDTFIIERPGKGDSKFKAPYLKAVKEGT